MLVGSLFLLIGIFVGYALSADCELTFIVLMIVDCVAHSLVKDAVECKRAIAVGKFSATKAVDIISVLVGFGVLAETIVFLPIIVVIAVD